MLESRFDPKPRAAKCAVQRKGSDGHGARRAVRPGTGSLRALRSQASPAQPLTAWAEVRLRREIADPFGSARGVFGVQDRVCGLVLVGVACTQSSLFDA